MAHSTSPRRYRDESATPARRYVLYARKSTEQDERQTQSIESQKVRSLEQAARTGAQIVEIYEESKSAKEPGRPVFNEIIRRIDAGEIDGIIAWHPDRLARNEIDAAAITFRLRKGGLKDLLFFEYTFINSPEGIMMLQMALSQSQYQVSKLSIDVTRGIEDKLALGWYPHHAPVGYVNDKHLLKGRKSISSDPERFPLLQQAWRLLLTGAHTAEEVRHILNDSWGFRTPIRPSGRGGGPIPRASFYNLLGNSFYAGRFLHAGEFYEGAHEPMVTMEEFRSVQRLIGRDKISKGEKKRADGVVLMPKGTQHPFTGMIRCGFCGSQVTVSVRTKPSGRSYTYYHCSNSRGKCSRAGLREDRLQNLIDAELARFDLDEDFYQWACEIVNRQSRFIREREEDQQKQRQRTVEESRKRLDALLDMKMNDFISDEEYRPRRERLMKEHDQLRKQIEAAHQGVDLCREACLNAIEFMKGAREWLASEHVGAKRLVARNLVSDWTLSDGKLLPKLHPLFVRVANEYPQLKAEKERIGLNLTCSENAKIEAYASIESQWSHIWDSNRTVVEGGVHFPDVAKQIKLLQ